MSPSAWESCHLLRIILSQPKELKRLSLAMKTRDGECVDLLLGDARLRLRRGYAPDMLPATQVDRQPVAASSRAETTVILTSAGNHK